MAVSSDVMYLPGVVAAGTLATKQYYVMKFASTAGQVKTAAAASDKACGVLQNDPASGQEAAVAYLGLAKVIAATSVGWSAGIPVGYNSTGQATPITLNSTTDNTLLIGIFPLLEGQATPAASQIISVVLLPGALRG